MYDPFIERSPTRRRLVIAAGLNGSKYTRSGALQTLARLPDCYQSSGLAISFISTSSSSTRFIKAAGKYSIKLSVDGLYKDV